MAAVIEVEHLEKRYGATVAVADATFSVEEGEVFGLLGRNGAGKTTTVECLQGLRHPDSGRLRVLGMDPSAEGQALRRRIGSQLQESALPDRMKVWEALDLFAALSPRTVDWRVLLDQWGLDDRRSTYFGDLSGGQRQRLLVALALVNDPDVVFLDEMTTGLDPAARRVAWDLIRAIQAKGKTVLLVTHFMDEAERLCDRIGIMHAGRIAAMDAPQVLVDRYAGARTVRFSADPSVGLAWLSAVPGVESWERKTDRVAVTGRGPVLALVAAGLVERGLAPEDLRMDQASLEDAFLAVTGEAFADEGRDRNVDADATVEGAATP